MTQLAYAYDERAGSGPFQSASATYVDASSPIILSTDLEAGRQYLLIARAECHRLVLDGSVGGVRLVHGSSPFDGAEVLFTQAVTASQTLDVLHAYFTVWTAVAGEDVRYQIKGDGVNLTGIRYASIVAIPLGADVGLTQGTDWLFDEVQTDSALVTGGTNGGSLTWTPAVAGQRWLILSHAALETDTANADSYVSRLDRTGEATASWDISMPGRAAGLCNAYPHMWVGTLGAVSQTWKEISRRIGTTAATANRRRSAILALRRSAFDVSDADFNDAKIDLLSTGAHFDTTLASVTPTQLVDQGAVLYLGAHVYEASLDSGQRSVYSKVIQGGSDEFTGYEASTYRFPYMANNVAGQHLPYFHMSTDPAVPAGATTMDMKGGISAAAASRGAKFRRLLYLSLDATPSGPPPGSGGFPNSEKNEQLMYQNDYDANRRRLKVRLVLASDHTSPATAEAGGVGQFSKNGGGFNNAPALVAEDAANGIYYVPFTQANLDTLGSAQFKYKSVNTDLFSVTVAVEELPWVWDGPVSSAAPGTLVLGGTPPAFIPKGAIAKIVGGTGLGQTAMVGTYATPNVTLETGVTWEVTPDATSRVAFLTGLPPNVPDANVAMINRSVPAAIGLQAGAEAVGQYSVVSGTNTPTQITTNLPTVVNGVATGIDFWRGRTITFKTGALAGDAAEITGSSVSGGNTILTLNILTGSPAVGTQFVIT